MAETRNRPREAAVKPLIVAVVFALTAAPVWARKPCDELKAEIEAKLQAKGVASYTLEVVDNDQVNERKVVGSCAGGSKKIVYRRGKPEESAPKK